MRKLQYLLSVIPVLFFVGVVQADDKADVKAAHDGMIAAWKAGDFDAIKKHYVAGMDFFDSSGNLLRKADWQNLAAWLDSGGKTEQFLSHYRQIELYDKTAIVTSYDTVTSVQPDAEKRTENRRVTHVFHKQGGQWKIVHVHLSLLTPDNP